MRLDPRRTAMTGRFAAPLFTLAMLVIASCALSQTPAATPAPPKVDTGDTAWMLTSSAFVMLMTPGLALFYGGMVRSKNVLNMIMQSFIALAVVSVLWVVVGYSLAFSKGTPFIGSLEWIGLRGVAQTPYADYSATIPHQVYMIYQMMFAIITPALISGAIAERMKFSTYVVFMALWLLLVYCPIAHMVWGADGFLHAKGALDFAGGTVVHMSSGYSALVLCIMLGKRKTDPSEDLRPHNLPMTLIGTALLWFGWFGFNAGSAVASGGLAGSAFVATHCATAMAALTWVLLEWLAFKKPTALGFATGAVAGLVAITPASGFVGVLSSLVIGGGVSVISFYGIRLKNKFGYDDTLDVFGVHGLGGTWGAIATGIFASVAVNAAGADGLTHGGGFTLLGKQLLAVGITLVWATVATFIIASILKAVMGLRSNADEEEIGLDLGHHGESAYSGTEQSGSAAVLHG
jgi:Amt family ammonium transporter